MIRLFIDDQELSVVQYTFDSITGKLTVPEKTTWMQVITIAGIVRCNTKYEKEIFTIRTKVLTKEDL